MTDTTNDLDEDLRREHEEAENALHNLIVKRIHGEDCGCKSEVHPSEQWDYYSRLADAVTPLFLPGREWGVLLTGRDSSQDVVWECDDREGAEDTAQKLSGYPVVVHRLGARLVGQAWTEAQR